MKLWLGSRHSFLLAKLWVKTICPQGLLQNTRHWIPRRYYARIPQNIFQKIIILRTSVCLPRQSWAGIARNFQCFPFWLWTFPLDAACGSSRSGQQSPPEGSADRSSSTAAPQLLLHRDLVPADRAPLPQPLRLGSRQPLPSTAYVRTTCGAQSWLQCPPAGSFKYSGALKNSLPAHVRTRSPRKSHKIKISF